MDNISLIDQLCDQVSVSINTLGIIKHDKNWREHRVHKDYDMWIMLSGCAVVRANDEIYELNKGDMFLFMPDVYYYAFSENSECSFIYIHFNFQLGENKRYLDSLNMNYLTYASSISKEYSIISEAVMELENKETMSKLAFKGYFTSLISKILALNVKTSETRHIKAGSIVEDIKRLKPAIFYINDHINENIKVSDISVLAGVSKKYFFSIFREAYGMSPKKYILELKMNRARELLMKRTYSIKEIAYELGYPDPFSFSKVFKKRFGISPSAFSKV